MLVVAVPEGLPLAVTLALAYSVRVRACSISTTHTRTHTHTHTHTHTLTHTHMALNMCCIFVRHIASYSVDSCHIFALSSSPEARFTKYLTTILRLSNDNAIVKIDLRWTTNLPNRLTKGERFFLGMIHLQNCKIV